VNQASWEMMDLDACREVVRLVEQACGDVRMHFVRPGTDIAHLARDALERGSTMVIAGGGDGTVSAIASVLAGTNAVLGVLPVGTLNHFARDLGIPSDIGEAARMLASGSVVRIDAAEVNGRVFINNSALGLYPEIVSIRARGQRKGLPKKLAGLVGLAHALARYRLLTVKVVADGSELVRTAPLVFVGNNFYVMEGFRIGARESLDRGVLSLVVPRHTSRLRLFLFSLNALLGHEPRRGLEVIPAREIRIESHHPDLLVSVDGEVARMSTPLVYRIRPRDLLVVAPTQKE
jgi:diacylglycerol kinase family enzyme